MKNEVLKGATLAAAVAALVVHATPTQGHRDARASGVTIAGHSCKGKNGCGAKPKDPNDEKKPQSFG